MFSREDLQGYDLLHEYGSAIVDGALRRGVTVELVDPLRGEIVLSLGHRSVRTREALSELTSAVALDRCQDKWAARRALAASGCNVPRARIASCDDDDLAFLAEVGSVVAKPARGAEGNGVLIDLRTGDELAAACHRASSRGHQVILEEMCSGVEIRVLTIGYETVAAIVRQPPMVTGDGSKNVRTLIDDRSQVLRRKLGESAGVPMDEFTCRTIKRQGLDLDTVLPAGAHVIVRPTSSLAADRLAGGILRDVTDDLHNAIRASAEAASQALEMPVLGLDVIAKRVDGADHVIIDANERPGLSNYEPQPVVDRFLELLFPQLGRAVQ